MNIKKEYNFFSSTLSGSSRYHVNANNIMQLCNTVGNSTGSNPLAYLDTINSFDETAVRLLVDIMVAFSKVDMRRMSKMGPYATIALAVTPMLRKRFSSQNFGVYLSGADDIFNDGIQECLDYLQSLYEV